LEPVPVVVHRGPGYRAADAGGPPRFHGEHQPGIATRQQAHLRLAGFDLAPDEDPAARLRAWSATAEALMREHAAARLTLTFGLGPSLFARHPELEDRRPVALEELPAFPGDAVDPARSGGDLGVQVCADDAAVVAAALAALDGSPRWTQAGTVGHAAPTPRNLLGFKDGTLNLRRPRDLDRHVWVCARDRTWMLGGTYLVYRRIRLDVSGWNRLPVEEQERAMGRRKVSGGPLGGGREFDARVVDGLPAGAHVRLAAPQSNAGASMLRRAYDFTDAPADAGLAFVCFVQDPRRQFVPMQRRLAEADALNAFATPTASAVFAVPPGCRPGGFVGDGLFVSPSRP
jgi:deferrochelatase/peroxidase EfeB